MAGRSVVIRSKLPAPGAPLGEVEALGAESGVLAVARVELRGVGGFGRTPGLHVVHPGLPTAALTWIAEGARKWYVNDQVAPLLIKEATEEWRKSCDVGYQFAVDYLTCDPNHYIHVAVMKSEVNAFLTSQGKKRWSSQLLNTTVVPDREGAAEA